MLRFLSFSALAALLLMAVSCTALVQARPPAFVLSDPVAVRDETSQDGIVRLKVGVWRRTYEVPGDGARDIGRSLNALRTQIGHGEFSAQTKWDLRWSVRYQEAGGHCSLAAVTIEYYAVVTLPVLADTATLSGEDLGRWSGFADALEAHEIGHVEREIAGAEALRQALLALPPQPDCQSIASQTAQIGEQAREAIRQSDQAFDAETEHGALSGATFP